MRSLRQRCEANDKRSRLSRSIFQFSIGGAVVCMMQYAKGQMVMQSLPDQDFEFEPRFLRFVGSCNLICRGSMEICLYLLSQCYHDLCEYFTFAFHCYS